MGVRGLVLGQTIRKNKLERARQLRREMTHTERLLWEHLRANRLCGFHFRRQHIIHGFIVDFYCHAAALVVEVDGAVHDRAVEYDEARDGILAARGLLILRLKNIEVVSDIKAVLAKIETACRRDLSPGARSLQGTGEHRGFRPR